MLFGIRVHSYPLASAITTPTLAARLAEAVRALPEETRALQEPQGLRARVARLAGRAVAVTLRALRPAASRGTRRSSVDRRWRADTPANRQTPAARRRPARAPGCRDRVPARASVSVTSAMPWSDAAARISSVWSSKLMPPNAAWPTSATPCAWNHSAQSCRSASCSSGRPQQVGRRARRASASDARKRGLHTGIMAIGGDAVAAQSGIAAQPVADRHVHAVGDEIRQAARGGDVAVRSRDGARGTGRGAAPARKRRRPAAR